MRRGMITSPYDMITSIDTVTQVSIKFRKTKEAHKNMGISIEHNTNNTYENGDKRVRIWKRREMCMYVYIQIRRNYNNKHADIKGGQKYGQGHAYNKSTVPRYVLNSQERRKRTERWLWIQNQKQTTQRSQHK